MGNGSEPPSGDLHGRRELHEVLGKLPLFENVFLHMQAVNISIVDQYIEGLEEDLLREYLDSDQPPLPKLHFLSAVTQMWVFALYELLRTWKQMVAELLDYATALDRIRGKSDFESRKKKLIESRRIKLVRPKPSADLEEALYWRRFVRIERSQSFVKQLQKAKAAVTPVFLRVERVRVTLAKHEVPRAGRPGRSYAAPYERMDTLTGSMRWIIDLSDGTSDFVTRRELADQCRGTEIA